MLKQTWDLRLVGKYFENPSALYGLSNCSNLQHGHALYGLSNCSILKGVQPKVKLLLCHFKYASLKRIHTIIEL